MKRWLPTPAQIVNYLILIGILWLSTRWIVPHQVVQDVIEDQVVTFLDDDF